jgi:hypothetical protein
MRKRKSPLPPFAGKGSAWTKLVLGTPGVCRGPIGLYYSNHHKLRYETSQKPVSISAKIYENPVRERIDLSVWRRRLTAAVSP